MKLWSKPTEEYFVPQVVPVTSLRTPVKEVLPSPTRFHSLVLTTQEGGKTTVCYTTESIAVSSSSCI